MKDKGEKGSNWEVSWTENKYQNKPLAAAAPESPGIRVTGAALRGGDESCERVRDGTPRWYSAARRRPAVDRSPSRAVHVRRLRASPGRASVAVSRVVFYFYACFRSDRTAFVVKQCPGDVFSLFVRFTRFIPTPSRERVPPPIMEESRSAVAAQQVEAQRFRKQSKKIGRKLSRRLSLITKVPNIFNVKFAGADSPSAAPQKNVVAADVSAHEITVIAPDKTQRMVSDFNFILADLFQTRSWFKSAR